jgi:T5SS/PEP-CTERM-associated repeat protein
LAGQHREHPAAPIARACAQANSSGRSRNVMPSLLPIGGTLRLNASSGGAATIVPLAEGGFAAVYRVANGPDVFTLFDDNFQPLTGEIDVTSTDFLAPQAAALNGGQFVVAWLDQDQSLEASIYNPDGSLAVGPVTIATPTDPTVGLSEPRIVGNAFGGFTAIWQDNATINGVTGTVFIQSYDSGGNPVGDPITVVPPTVDPSNQASINDFRIAVLGDGTVVVAAQVQINGVDEIMSSVNGGALTLLAGGDPNYIYTNPQIAALAGGGYVITYDFVNPNLVGTDAADANWTTGGVVFASDGTQHDFAIGTTVTTTNNGTFAVDPSVITPLADGGFIVTFEPLQSPLGDGYLVDAQQFDAFGNAVGPVVLVTPQGFLPSVATAADGVVLDTYQYGSGIFLQPYSSAPTPQGPEPVGTSFGLNSVVSANTPGVAPLTTGGFVVVYQDQNSNAWAEIYGYNRQPVGSAFEVAAGGTQPVVASQSNGTFLVAWSNGSQIMGAVYDNQGDLLGGPFSMSGSPASLPVLDPALNSMPDGGYMLAYETDLEDGTGSHLVTIQEFDGDGNAVGASVSQNFAPTNPLAPPKIAALEAQLFGSVTVIGVGDAIVAAIVSAPPTGNSSAGVAGLGFEATSQQGTPPTTSTITVSGSNDGATRSGAQVATLDDGNIVVVWSEAGATSETWSIVGQVMTPAGGFVGSQFSISTALPSNSPAAQIALSALPDGGFLVTYDAGNTSLASQRFDASGDAVGAPVLMTGSGQADVVTTVLSNGTLLLASDSTPAGGGGNSLVGQTYSLPALPMNWTGATSSSLGTATNWDIDAAPDSGHVMQFELANGGTLTGTATAEAALFTGQGAWVLSGADVNIVQGITEQSTLQIGGGTLTAAGAAVIDGPVTVSAGGQVAFLSTGIGTSSGETGMLSLSGAGTSWTDTGTNGNGGFQAGASTGSQPGDGIISVTQNAVLTGSDTDVLGVTAGSEGDLSIATGGTVSDASLVAGAAGVADVTVNGGLLTNSGTLTMGQSAGGQGVLTVSGSSAAMTASGAVIVGEAGIGSLEIQNQGTVQTGGTTVASDGIDTGQLTGGIGTITVAGAKSLLSNTGEFIVGDAGLGNLSIESGATAMTTPGTTAGAAGLVIGNAAGASGSSVDVSGAGSRLEVAGLLDVGVAGAGALELAGGATVTALSLDAGNVAAGVGQISVTGVGTDLLVTNAATVADDGTGVLSVLDGATFAAASLTIGSQGDSSGALVVSGSGSEVQLSGALNIGTSLGTGDLTVGPGAAVYASVVNLQGQVVLEGGLLDPTVQLINQGQTAGGYGTLAAGDIVDEGVIQAGGTKPSQKLLLVQGTVLGGGTLTANGTLPGSSSAGILQINAGGTLELTGAVLNAATTTFTDDLTPTGTYTVNNSVVDVTFADAAGVLKLDDIAGFGGTITTYQHGDSFVITGGTLSDLGVSNNNTLTVADSGAGAGADGIDDIIFGSAISAAGFDIVNNNTVQVACFAAGTGIATTRGLVPVESIRPGERVCTVLGGDTAEVIWVGQRSVDCARHPDPTKVWPVRVVAHAFGRGMPASDLVLSPDHAVYVDRVLIPIRLLVNGHTVRQELTDRVCYHHIELAQHDVLLANGMPAESYLDTGDRARFSNGGVITLHPDFSARAWEMHGCAPLVQTGPILAAVRKRLAADVARRKRGTAETVAPGTRFPG